MRHLFLDDERVPGDVTWIQLDNAVWEVVRSYDQAIEWVLRNGFPDVISFDHDLGYEEFEIGDGGFIVVTNATEEKSGYDFAKWLLEYDMDNGAMPDHFRFTVHSMNPIGAENIRLLLNDYIRHRTLNR